LHEFDLVIGVQIDHGVGVTEVNSVLILRVTTTVRAGANQVPALERGLQLTPEHRQLIATATRTATATAATATTAVSVQSNLFTRAVREVHQRLMHFARFDGLIRTEQFGVRLFDQSHPHFTRLGVA
jgi:hypothetical protein